MTRGLVLRKPSDDEQILVPRLLTGQTCILPVIILVVTSAIHISLRLARPTYLLDELPLLKKCVYSIARKLLDMSKNEFHHYILRKGL